MNEDAGENVGLSSTGGTQFCLEPAFSLDSEKTFPFVKSAETVARFSFFFKDYFNRVFCSLTF